MDFRAISRDIGRKILRPRFFFENFGPKIIGSEFISRGAACRLSAQMLGISEGRERAAHHAATWISARSRVISNAKFRGREKFSKISVGNPLRIARNLARRCMPMLCTDVEDLCRSCASCEPPGGTDFGAISRDFGRKILRPRKILQEDSGYFLPILVDSWIISMTLYTERSD